MMYMMTMFCGVERVDDESGIRFVRVGIGKACRLELVWVSAIDEDPN